MYNPEAWKLPKDISIQEMLDLSRVFINLLKGGSTVDVQIAGLLHFFISGFVKYHNQNTHLVHELVEACELIANYKLRMEGVRNGVSAN